MTIINPVLLILLLPLLFLFWYEKKDFISKVHLIILILLLLTLTRPVIEQQEIEAKIEGHDIIIAIDVSFSMNAKMNATDLLPSRYLFAKECIHFFLEQNPHSNIMLIAFTSNPLLLSPPTTDHELIIMALDSLDPQNILTKGTSLKRLFEKIVVLDSGHKDLILMSDGGEERNVQKLSTLLNSIDISLHILAMGTEQGSTIPTKNSGLLKDKNGNLIVSRVNPLLKSLSHSVGGDYIEAQNSPKKTAQLLTQNLSDEKKEIDKKEHKHLELYQIPLGIAIILFMLLHTSAREKLKKIFL
ncbi:MAG: VWA domain-containing protein [Sulfurovaceae bacterium]|nr:VWA domain-containing protein [Sulfurovaceae bacterium]